MHDFAVTENYAIFMDHALIFDGEHMVKANSLPFRCASFLSYQCCAFFSVAEIKQIIFCWSIIQMSHGEHRTTMFARALSELLSPNAAWG